MPKVAVCFMPESTTPEQVTRLVRDTPNAGWTPHVIQNVLPSGAVQQGVVLVKDVVLEGQDPAPSVEVLGHKTHRVDVEGVSQLAEISSGSLVYALRGPASTTPSDTMLDLLKLLLSSGGTTPKPQGVTAETAPKKDAEQDDSKDDAADAKDDEKDKTDKVVPAANPAIKAEVEALEGIHKEVWEGLSKQQKQQLASKYIQEVIRDEASESEAEFYTAAPEIYLLNKMGNNWNGREEFIQRLLLLKAGLKSNQIGLEAEELLTATKRNAVLDVGLEIAKEALSGMQRWKKLIYWAVAIMIALLIFSIYVIVKVLLNTPLNQLDGYLIPVIIFVLALFSVSPAVLLLLQRPLEGIDKFMPAGKPEAKDGDEGSGKSDGGAAAKGDAGKGGSTAASK